jgi:membrane protein implicated in regulation of membrane protease activity
MDLLTHILSGGAYSWWAVALLLLLVEMMVPSNWLLWPGLSAFIVGAILMIAPDLGWQLAIFIFVGFSVLFLFLGRKFIQISSQHTDAPNLNNRAQRMVGRRGAAQADGVVGMSRIQIDGIEWPVRLENQSEINAGDLLEIIAFDGTTLVAKVIQV